MPAVRLLARSEWEAILHAHNCERWEGTHELKTVEVWETEHGKLFFVPMDNSEGRLRDEDLNTVLVQVAKLRPISWDDP